MPLLSRSFSDVSSLEEFDSHRDVSFVYDEETKLTGVIAIHRANKGIPSFGATRLWHYPSFQEGVSDALRLSRLMSYKAALAGLPCGGAKGVIFERPEYASDPQLRERMLERYADRVNLMGRSFVTGTDVGISQQDLQVLGEHSPQIIGFNDNTTEFTAFGVIESIKVSLEQVFGDPAIAGRSFAVQGLGKIGSAVVDGLMQDIGSGTVYVSDVNPLAVKAVQKRHPDVIVVSSDVIHKQDVDVFSPCALSGELNPRSVSEIKAKIIAGGANNQLSREQVGDTLFGRDILYAPDYVVNAGGIIAIYDEYENPDAYDALEVKRKVMHVPSTLRSIFAESKEKNMAPHRIANIMAERIFNTYG